MFVVLALVDEVADIVQNRGVFKPVSFRGPQTMEANRLVEETQGQGRDMKAMDFRSLTAAGQRDDGAAPQVWNFRFRFESFTVSMDIVVDDAFTNGFVAQNKFISPGHLHRTAKDQRGWKQG